MLLNPADGICGMRNTLCGKNRRTRHEILENPHISSACFCNRTASPVNGCDKRSFGCCKRNPECSICILAVYRKRSCSADRNLYAPNHIFYVACNHAFDWNAVPANRFQTCACLLFDVLPPNADCLVCFQVFLQGIEFQLSVPQFFQRIFHGKLYAEKW